MPEIEIAFNDRRIQYTAAGAEADFAYDFPIYEQGHLVVIETDDAGAQTELVYGSDYTLTGIGVEAGGDVVLDVGVYPTGAPADYIYTIYSDVPEERLSDYQFSGDFTSAEVNKDFDIQIMIAQQLRRDLDRGLRLDITDSLSSLPLLVESAATRIDKALFFNASGTGIITKDVADFSAVVLPLSIANGGSSASTAAGARTAFGLGTSATVNTGTSGATIPLLNGANTWSAIQKILLAGEASLRIASTDTTVGTSKSRLYFSSRSDASTERDMASIAMDVATNTDGAENGLLHLRTRRGGSPAARLSVGAGIYANGATDQGTGTINGNLYHNGTVLGALATLNSPSINMTMQAASGTAVDFTSIPSGVKRITISFDGVSTSGTDDILFLLGDSGGIENSGYLNRTAEITSAGTVFVSATASFRITSGSTAATAWSGSMILTLMDAATNLWSCQATFGGTDIVTMNIITGSKALSGVLDRVRITTLGGTETFDAGNISVQYGL